jgi:hypothetical protein
MASGYLCVPIYEPAPLTCALASPPLSRRNSGDPTGECWCLRVTSGRHADYEAQIFVELSRFAERRAFCVAEEMAISVELMNSAATRCERYLTSARTGVEVAQRHRLFVPLPEKRLYLGLIHFDDRLRTPNASPRRALPILGCQEILLGRTDRARPEPARDPSGWSAKRRSARGGRSRRLRPAPSLSRNRNFGWD